MSVYQEITQPHVEQLRQLAKQGAVWDGNLISKQSRDWLFLRNCVHRHDGYNFLALEGLKLALLLGLIKK